MRKSSLPNHSRRQNYPTPPQYIYQQQLLSDITTGYSLGFFVWANLLALLPLSAGVFALYFPYHFYIKHSLNAFLPDPQWSISTTLMVGAVIVVGSMLLHEYLHGFVLWLGGHQPRYLVKQGVPVAGAAPDAFLTRNHFLIMALTPFFAMTILGGLLLIWLPPTLGQIWLVALLLNCAASVGDIYVANRVRRFSADTLFADQSGISVFVPAKM